MRFNEGWSPMRGTLEVGIVLSLVALAMPGCATTSDARYVYQDSEFGVVAIPKNTPEGPEHYREQAESLMARHFPEGYEIVRAEEVVEGSRTLTAARTGSAELAPQVAPHLLAFLKVGGGRTTSQSDTVNLTECRIIYKKAESQSATAPGKFAPEPTATPTAYLDPNLVARKQDREAKDKDKEPIQVARATASTDQKASPPGASPASE
jgi:hypothetical protein